MFLQNQGANLAQSAQDSWPTFLANGEPCLMPLFTNSKDWLPLSSSAGTAQLRMCYIRITRSKHISYFGLTPSF